MRYAGPLVVVMIVAEIVAAVQIAEATSWGLMLVLLLGLSAFGAGLIRREITAAFRAGRTAAPGTPAGGLVVADGIFRVAAASLVFLPGFVTGALGLLALVPPIRRLVEHRVGVRWQRTMQGLIVRSTRGPRTRRQAADPGVIDGEIDRDTL